MALPVAIALLTFAACSRSNHEPTYQGRSFSQWYKRYGEATDKSGAQAELQAEECRRAIREMAPQIVPLLLEALRDEIHKGKESRVCTTCVFLILGPRAETAVPELETTMSQLPTVTSADPKEFGRIGGARKDIAYCLAVIGDPAIPSITKLLADPQPETRYHTAYQFGAQLEFGDSFKNSTNLQQAIPALIKCTEDEDQYTAIAAIDCLAAINMQPGETIPALQKALRSARAEVRERAQTALGKIGK